MADTPDIDGQDVAEVFDEDNTNIDARRRGGGQDVEQFEDLPDVYDVTSKAGDDDDDEAAIGEDMDDDEIVDQASLDNDDDLEDDDLKDRFPEKESVEDPEESADLGLDDPDLVDGMEEADPNEVSLSYAGDLTNVAGATSSAADMESDSLSDEDLRELDYKD